MVRHFVGLQSLVYTIYQAYKVTLASPHTSHPTHQELGLILLMFVVTVLMFSSLIFAFEREGARAVDWTFYDCIWWGLMTLTTVGYHLQPTTFCGKFICGLCALCGVFILTLPIPIVVSRSCQPSQSCYSQFPSASLSATRGNSGGTRSPPGGGWPAG